MKKLLMIVAFVASAATSIAQDAAATRWVDSVFKTLTNDQKIGQLMVVRLSSLGPNRTAIFQDSLVRRAIDKYNIGGICLFQGDPVRQANLLNEMQALAKTPIIVAVDAEWGLGMRMDSVKSLPRQMMLGAVQDPSLIYEYGRVVAEQLKRMGVHINYAPVIDVNNNPMNPVINDRSFGEDKYKVAAYGIQYMKGMQDNGIIATAKHFPGHGDVSVDSHYDLPVINKSMPELEALELYPFRELSKAGVGSMMIAHLAVPSIDKDVKRPTSTSAKAVNDLLRKEIGFQGIIVTDGLEMKGLTKNFPEAEGSVEALVAGNDMLCLPEDIDLTIEKVKKAIRKKRLKWATLDQAVKRVLYAKYQVGLNNYQPINTENLTADLNASIDDMRRLIAENAITLLRNNDPAIFPLLPNKRVAYVGIGLKAENVFAQKMRENYNAHTYFVDYKMEQSKVKPMLEYLKDQYDVVVIGLHQYSRVPANNYGISHSALSLMLGLQLQHKTITLAFGNPYALSNFCGATAVIACYDDDPLTQQAAADLLLGRFNPAGRLPITACDSFKAGDGIVTTRALPTVIPSEVGINTFQMNHSIDSIMHDAIQKEAIPGGVVLVAKNGKIIFEKGYGKTSYISNDPVYPETIYDLASITKVMATTVAVMKLYDEGKLDLQKTLGDYLAWTKGSDKANLKLWDVLLHEARLKSFIPFYQETIDPKTKLATVPYFSQKPQDGSIQVADQLYLRKDFIDTMYTRILQSPLEKDKKYIYSDNDFIFLGLIVEAITGMSLNDYTVKTFYEPLGMKSTGFNPLKRFPKSYIAPTEAEKMFRGQLIQGYVHDPGAAMFGGIAGHAGLFSNAGDLAVLAQVLLNGGELNGTRFFRKSTVDYFTDYHSQISRRGLGFDKPEKDNATRAEAYPTASASLSTFGHTGFTGTCIWIDPEKDLIFIFLSNRVNSADTGKFLRMSVRPKVHEAIYKAIEK
ncbi:glycoside hydrolase family 3 N-terminal domain-containing protein [Gynurincola endophyticus]|uniref:glycoside hydrolase family 3 N-terminal domain-containing protein n=1 Tax=Gynurincola endophyticus TaxID=2479004 RepID=UPI000F8CCCAF|nr:glycoside hydrolase family 3 N-terminal domain-containing protein [Gynurincola endophyticus]